MSNRHPESIFSTKTWKDEDGNGGLRNLYGILAFFLAENHMAMKQSQKTRDQTEVRRKAARYNFQKLYNIGARIKNGEYVTPQEKEIWERVEYDVNKEVLRGTLRAFDSTVLKNKFHSEMLEDKQSGMVEIFDYIKKNQQQIENWEYYTRIQKLLKKMNINFPE